MKNYYACINFDGQIHIRVEAENEMDAKRAVEAELQEILQITPINDFYYHTNYEVVEV